MRRQPVHCATLVKPDATDFVLFHQQLGCFHADRHQHTWGQLIYAEQGCIQVSGQGRILLIPSGNGVWIPAHTDHEIWSDSPQLLMRAVCFPPDEDQPALSPQITVFPMTLLLGELLRYTEKWGSGSDEPSARTFLRAIQELLPDELARARPFYLPSTTHPRLLPVLTHIQAHLSGPIRFAELADAFGLSERTLNRLFTQQLGLPFSRYCKIARILKALELIDAGQTQVSQLALDVGYESLATFSTNFLEICGHRPRHFMQKRR